MAVKPKKHLGQHFLKEASVAKKIADTLSLKGYDKVLEIGPGMGVLTAYLLEKPVTTYAIEIDSESITYLQAHFLELSNRIIKADVLKYDFSNTFGKDPLPSLEISHIIFRLKLFLKCLKTGIKFQNFQACFKRKLLSESVSMKGQNPMEFYQFWFKPFTMQSIYLQSPRRFLTHLQK